MEEIETRRNEIIYRRDGAGLAPELSRQRAITICLISSFYQPRNMPVEACHGNHDQPGTSLR